MTYHLVKLGLVSATLLLAACAQDNGTVLNRVELKKDEFFTTGARQRVVTNSEIGKKSTPGIADPLRLVCTEPSPDVAVAVANSFSSGLSILGKGSGSISAAQVEAMAQLVERTASIQLLRDKMYQTCLAYSNGAISGTTYSLVMSRLDDTIVSLLLGETAGGAFGRKLTGLTTETDAGARAGRSGMLTAVRGVEEFANELALAQKKVDEKTETLRVAEANAQGKDPLPKTNQDAIDEAKRELEGAKVERDRILNSLKGELKTATIASGTSSVETGGAIGDKTNPLIAQELGNMQEAFLRKDFSDFYVNACLIEMGLGRGRLDKGELQTLSALTVGKKNAGKVVRDELEKLTPLRNPSRLVEFCEKNLASFIDMAKKQSVALETERLKISLEEAKASEVKAVAAAELAKARTEEARATALAAFNKAVEACDKFSDAKVKETCVSKLPSM